MLEAFALTDPGCLRTNNEDYFISDSFRGIFILADGMGGANAGEYASRLSAETLYQFLLNINGQRNLSDLEQGFTRANSSVREASAANTNLEGMGTTLVAVRFVGDTQIHLASVGDSRAYQLSGNEFSVLTKDHTWVTEVGVPLGLSNDALRRHPMRHVLTMAVGVSDELRVDMRDITLERGTQILLCSDGLHSVIDEQLIETELRSEKSLPDKAQYLIEAAKAKGGPDNITVVLIRIL